MKILITGQSSGFGKAIAEKFKSMGAQVYGIGRTVTGEYDDECQCDFGDTEEVEEKLPAFVSGLPRMDYVILNAGMLGELQRASRSTTGALEEAMRVNVYAHKVLIDALLEKNEGCKNIIAISSGAAKGPKHGWLEYCLTKGALKMLLEVYSVENEHVKFVSIAPGLIKTKMQEQILNTDVREVPSVAKFHNLYDSMSSPSEVAEKFVGFLDNLRHLSSGDFVDMRTYKPPISIEEYRSVIGHEEKSVVSVDFDGVIHDCSRGFQDGTIYGEPTDGSLQALRSLSEHHDLIVFSVRAREDRPLINGKTGTELIWEWLKKYNVESYVKEVTCKKPRAAFYIDDKAIEFQSWDECLLKIVDRL